MIFTVRKEIIWNKSIVIDILPMGYGTNNIEDLAHACKWFKEESERYTKYYLDEILDGSFGNFSITASRVFKIEQATKNESYDAYCIGTIWYTTDNKEYETDEVEISYYYKQ